MRDDFSGLLLTGAVPHDATRTELDGVITPSISQASHASSANKPLPLPLQCREGRRLTARNLSEQPSDGPKSFRLPRRRKMTAGRPASALAAWLPACGLPTASRILERPARPAQAQVVEDADQSSFRSCPA